VSSNRIIQSDNAVLDLNTISTMIDTINGQQKAIEDLQAQVFGTSTTVDPATGQPATQSGPLVIDYGHTPVTSGTVTVKFNKQFKSAPVSVVGTILTSSGNQGYAYVSKTITASEAVFTIVSKSNTYKNYYLYWVAVGY